jgi:hypothetical protein
MQNCCPKAGKTDINRRKIIKRILNKLGVEWVHPMQDSNRLF